MDLQNLPEEMAGAGAEMGTESGFQSIQIEKLPDGSTKATVDGNESTVEAVIELLKAEVEAPMEAAPAGPDSVGGYLSAQKPGPRQAA